VVYRKNGTRLQTSSLYEFWNNAGVQFAGFLGDSRVLFDPFSHRFIASTGEFNNGTDMLLVAISKSADPRDGWTGFRIPFRGPVGTFIDFPTLGFNRDAVYVYSNGAVLVLPKVDLLAPTPSVARASLLVSFALLTPVGSKAQPIVNLGDTPGPEPLLGSWDGTQLRRWSVVGGPLSPSLDASGAFIPVTAYQVLLSQGAMQPGTGIGVFTDSLILPTSVVLQNGVMWGVQTVGFQGRFALRWFAIDAASNVLLREGLITMPDRDAFMGSIAVNSCNDVVIGFNVSGPSEFVSVYAVAGSTTGRHTEFGAPVLLKRGVAPYTLTGGAPFARWGDYSATMVDPKHPRRFWTVQEWPSARDVWSIQITELRVLRGRRDDVGEDDDNEGPPRSRGGHAEQCRGDD
jgi:hypothetical protein